MQKPRGFHHNYIYVDERKEKLDKMKEDAKRELGMAPPKEFSPEDIRGKIFAQTKHVRRRRESGKRGKYCYCLRRRLFAFEPNPRVGEREENIRQQLPNNKHCAAYHDSRHYDVLVLLYYCRVYKLPQPRIIHHVFHE